MTPFGKERLARSAAASASASSAVPYFAASPSSTVCSCGSRDRAIECSSRERWRSEYIPVTLAAKMSRKLEDRIERLRQLRATAPDGETVPTLRKALQDRANLVVAESARAVACHHLTSLIPDLI